MNEQIAGIRAFNRFYTRQIGLLEEQFNDSPLSLAEARVLYEIDARGHTTARELMKALRMDRGYLSRVLRKFADAELIALLPNPADRRSSNLALTADGDLLADRLNAHSDSAVAALIHRLSAGERAQLTAAMRAIRRLLGDDLPAGEAVLRPHRLGELGWLVHRQAVLYASQFGWNGEFEALIARLYADYEAAPDTPPKKLWIAELDGEVAGSVFVVPAEAGSEAAQLRMLYVEPAARGRGLGRRLVAEAVGFARDAGYPLMRLWTHSVQDAARRLYAEAGFRCVETGRHHAFGQDLEREYWEREL